MEITDFIIDFKKLCIVFNKPFGQEECDIYYDLLKDQQKKVFTTAVGLALRECKFFPKPSELIEYCKKASSKNAYVIVEFMREQGYFKCTSEYTKTLFFIEHNTIPKWLKEDITKYYYKMIGSENKQIAADEQLLLN